MSIAVTSLHELGCTGATHDTGCVCPPTFIRRPRATERYLHAAAEKRERIEGILSGIEALTAKLEGIGDIPLDLVDRYERTIVTAHVANLKRLSKVSERALAALEDA